MDTLDRYISQVRSLPPAPRILTELLGALAENDIQTERVVELVAFDPALTAKVLQCCNSAALGRSQRVSDLSEAVTVLGFNEIFRLVAGMMAKSTLEGQQEGYGIGQGELWRHSVASAVAARILGSALGAEQNAVFTAALLHDVGKLVLSSFLTQSRGTIVDKIEEWGHSFLEAEKSILGVDHAEIGARLLAQWNFPENLVEAVRWHHNPPAAQRWRQSAACVFAGDMISRLVGHGYGYHAYAVRVDGAVMQSLSITETDILLLALQTDKALKTIEWFPKGSVHDTE